MVGNHPTRPGKGGRIQVEFLVSVSVSQKVSHFLIPLLNFSPGPLFSQQGPSFPHCPSLRCSLPWRPEALSPGSLPRPSPISGLRCTLYCHSPPRAWVGFRNGTGSRGRRLRTSEPDRGRGLAPAIPAPKYKAGHTSVPNKGLLKQTGLISEMQYFTLDR